MQPSAEQLCATLEQSQLLTSQDVARIRTRWFRPGREGASDGSRFARWLVLNHFVTEFAVELLNAGRTDLFVWGNYRLRDQLRTGPLAGAYLATDPLGRPVLLEVLAAEQARDPSALLQFQETARRAMAVRHPQVAGTLEVGQAHGRYFLVKEHCEGELLSGILERRGRLSPHAATRFFALALAGLQALHEHGVPAHDLGPNALLLSDAGKGQRTVKLLLTGVSRHVFDHNLIQPGTQSLIPEDLKLADSLTGLRADQAVAPRPEGDIFRLGCTFYQALTGQRAYEPGEMPEPRRPARPIVDLAPEVPEMLAGIVEQMVAPLPADRPRKAAHVAKSLRVFLATEEEARAARIEDNIAPPPSPTAEVEAPPPEEQEHFEQPRRVRREGPVAEPRSKFAEVWDEVRPTERDLVFMGGGALALLALILVLRLITGWHFINLVCLLAGGALAFFAERFIRWREGRDT